MNRVPALRLIALFEGLSDADLVPVTEACAIRSFPRNAQILSEQEQTTAILFILFDLEIAFLFPWAIVLDQIGLFGFVAMMIFLAILVVGFIYEWKKGALEWE